MTAVPDLPPDLSPALARFVADLGWPKVFRRAVEWERRKEELRFATDMYIISRGLNWWLVGRLSDDMINWPRTVRVLQEALLQADDLLYPPPKEDPAQEEKTARRPKKRKVVKL